jgi:RNA polymerase sigma-70 factor (ECF subfamily)
MYSRAGLLRRPALVNGMAGLVVMLDGEPHAIMAFVVSGGRIVEIDILRDPARVSKLDLTALDG